MNFNSLLRQRPLFLAAFLVCAALIATALTMQYALELAPGALEGVTGAVRYSPPFADLA